MFFSPKQGLIFCQVPVKVYAGNFTLFFPLYALFWEVVWGNRSNSKKDCMFLWQYFSHLHDLFINGVSLSFINIFDDWCLGVYIHCTVQYTEYSVQYSTLRTLYSTVHWVQCTVQYTEYSVQYSTLSTLYSTVHWVQCTVRHIYQEYTKSFLYKILRNMLLLCKLISIFLAFI